jgi:hypothetical protein
MRQMGTFAQVKIKPSVLRDADRLRAEHDDLRMLRLLLAAEKDPRESSSVNVQSPFGRHAVQRATMLKRLRPSIRP